MYKKVQEDRQGQIQEFREKNGEDEEEEDGDDEYKEDEPIHNDDGVEEKDNGDDDLEEEVEEEEEELPHLRRASRASASKRKQSLSREKLKRKASALDEDEEEDGDEEEMDHDEVEQSDVDGEEEDPEEEDPEEDDPEEDPEDGDGDGDPEEEDEDHDDEDSKEHGEGDDGKEAKPARKASNNRKRHKPGPRPGTATWLRGRKPPPELVDENGKKLEVKNDEVVLPVDENGEKKVEPNGHLKGGRRYRIKNFTVKDRGDTLYMLSTEVARMMGFRDSYLFFQKHKFLYKYIISDRQKTDLVDRNLMPLSYKARVIGLVTARSCFREFGCDIVENGRVGIDDYKTVPETDERYGQLSEPPLPYGYQEPSLNKVVLHHQPPNIELRKSKYKENWIYESALAVLNYNADLGISTRKPIRDSYTSIKMVPQLTQPSHSSFKKLDDKTTKKLIFETRLKGNLGGLNTGLKDVPLELFNDIVDEDTKQAILKQQKFEADLEEL
ncbi:hypothetical protein PACTADRAFT_34868 [Pachysolen tannophilus NRRL Y-2460]|uniref:Chromatin structure-remodeling complex subunit RSC7 n=1 Tax=Pachysolen tannophilus NRRL Y-2460 TaxID=669874 RepID=A0A1E4TQN5_PACTA|nr:hypothetical protein PACTADRAFT_34868 [Pachysolen tannophilus NRRL Y-2460]